MKRAMRAGALALSSLLPALVSAQTTGGLAVGGDRLTNGRESWRNESVFIEHKSEGGFLGGLRANTTQRFGLNDQQFEAFYSRKLSDTLRAGIDGNLSSSHQVLAKSSLGGTLTYEFAPAWLLNGGVRQSRYDAVTVNQLSLGAEHYFGDWGAALTVVNSNSFSENAQTWVGRLSRYYGDRDRINLLLAAGREPTSIAGTIVTSDVRSVTLTGRHWIAPRVAIDYAVGRTRQGDFYSRTGGSLGLVVAF